MLAGNTQLFAIRPEGEILQLTRNSSIKNWSSGAPKGWWATYGAVVASNWQVVDAVKLQEMMNQRAGQGG